MNRYSSCWAFKSSIGIAAALALAGLFNVASSDSAKALFALAPLVVRRNGLRLLTVVTKHSSFGMIPERIKEHPIREG